MKNVIKKFITYFICCVLFGMSTYFQIPAEAKVIEPEIVKTETWTTSYFIDDDIETLYPYIQCEADIYNDGTIKLYMWNTHEWDGFSIYKQRAVIPYSVPYNFNSPYMCLATNGYTLWEDNGRIAKLTKLEYTTNMPKQVDLSFYPSNYSCDKHFGKFSAHGFDGFQSEPYVNGTFDDFIYCDNISTKKLTGYVLIYNGSLAELTFTDNESGFVKSKHLVYTFTPKTYLTENCIFTLFGHSFIITSDLLSGNIVASPKPTAQEKYIEALEEQNKYLTEQLNNCKSVDVDNDDMITAVDAQNMLKYYVESLAGKYSGRVEDYGDYVSRNVRTDS